MDYDAYHNKISKLAFFSALYIIRRPQPVGESRFARESKQAGNNIISASSVSSIKVVVDASDDVGVTRVDFFIDGVQRGTDTIADPLYEFTWDITSEITGIDHTIYVKAFDEAGNNSAALVAVRINP